MNLNNLTLAAVHLPDTNGGPFTSIQDALAHGYDTMEPVTGTVQIGVMIEGAFIPILIEKASLVHDAIELAKVNAAKNPPAEATDQGQAMGSNVPTGNAYTEPPAAPTETPSTDQPQG